MENAGMDSKEYTKLLDILAKAGQTTGVSVSTLAENLTKTGPTMRTLGFTTEETIAMMAKFEKEGLNTETVLAGMKKAVAYFGKEGVNAEAGFRRVLNAIKEAPDIAHASEIAIEAFGSKAGPELVEDVRAGKLEYQDFLKVLEDSTGTVTDTYEATQDGFDKIKLAIQGGKADLGSWVREIATEYQDEILAFIDKVKKGIKNVIQWVVRNGDLIIETIKSIVKVLATLWAVKKAAAFANVINGVITAIKGMATATAAATTATTAMNGATGILASLVSPGGAVVLGITAVIAVTASLISIFKEEKKEIDVLTEAQHKSVEESHALKVPMMKWNPHGRITWQP
jgi:phage-related minor tail protein